MSDWAKILGSYENSGVLNEVSPGEVASIRKRVRVQGLTLFRVDLAGIRDKTNFFSKISSSLGFPSYFGYNWDALEEMVRDFSWHPAKGYVIIIENPGELEQNAPQDYYTARDIFTSAASHWKDKQKLFVILLLKNIV